MAKRKSVMPEVSGADEVLLHPHEYRRLSVGWQSIISHVIWCISPMLYACLHHCHHCGYDVSGSHCHRMPSPDVCASARGHRLVVPVAASDRSSIGSRKTAATSVGGSSGVGAVSPAPEFDNAYLARLAHSVYSHEHIAVRVL